MDMAEPALQILKVPSAPQLTEPILSGLHATAAPGTNWISLALQFVGGFLDTNAILGMNGDQQ